MERVGGWWRGCVGCVCKVWCMAHTPHHPARAGNSIRTVFECVVFLFVVHPFDVGDTVLLGGEQHKARARVVCVCVWWRGAAASVRSCACMRALRPTPPLHTHTRAHIHSPTAPLHLLQVEEIALLNTTLLRWDGARIWQPNARLAGDALLNLSRSENKSEAIKVGECS